MASIDGMLLDFKRLDQLATGTTTLHRLDARAKVLVTLVFVLCVVSFGKYEIASLLPFSIFPFVLLSRGNLPSVYFARKIAMVLPFAFLVGAFNPLFDREILLQLGPVSISGGWVSCVSIMVRALLTVGTALLLVGVTGFTDICRALERLGMPKVFAVQLLFLYRYLFVLTEEAGRAARARDLRSFGRQGQGVVPAANIIGHLLLRTWQRAERIHMAMLARGFSGEFHTITASRFASPELLFTVGWTALFLVLRLFNIPLLVGTYVTGLFA